ncbi:MAG: hypothetical protein ACI4U3_06140 [Traorella sp.]
MENRELELLNRAKMYMDKLANGIHPVTGEVLPDSDVVNDIKVSRCLFYILNVLQHVIDNRGVVSKKSNKKETFSITQEELNQYDYSNQWLSVSQIAQHISSLVKNEQMKRLKTTSITNWLEYKNILTYKLINEKKQRIPTEEGIRFGIKSETKVSYNNQPYETVYYNQTVQRFIVERIYEILEYENNKTTLL